MRCTLAGRRAAIVAGDTGVRGRTVIKARDQPIIRAMTNIARRGGRNMRGTLAGGNHAVMTTFTGAIHFIVVH